MATLNYQYVSILYKIGGGVHLHASTIYLRVFIKISKRGCQLPGRLFIYCVSYFGPVYSDDDNMLVMLCDGYGHKFGDIVLGRSAVFV